MTDLLYEELHPLAKVGGLLPSRPHRSTGIRWADRGVRGFRLETVTIGGRRYTSREALARFIAHLNSPRSANEPQVSSLRERQQNSAAQRAEEIFG
jgi:Protein of unknown function (DUF1580)